MEGYEVIVELKTGKRRQGILTSADDNMNMTLMMMMMMNNKVIQQNNNETTVDAAAAHAPPVDASFHPTLNNNNDDNVNAALTTNMDGPSAAPQRREDKSWIPVTDIILPINTPQQQQQQQQHDNTITIRGSQVRYVQFPDNANLSAIVLSGRDREQQARNKYRKTLRKSSSH
jgi:small nuclear ribonucleoprotein (snRNP)-like protein